MNPAVGFTRGGMLVAVSAGEGRVYRTNDWKVRRAGTFDGPGKPPLAVLPTGKLNGFAVFAADGVVRVYQVPEGGNAE